MADREPLKPPAKQFADYGGPAFARFDIRADWLPLTRDPVMGFFELKAKIRVASDELEQILLFREAPSPRHRSRYVVGLCHLIPFLKEIGFSERVFLELCELVNGLDDLNRGIVRHYLAPSSVAGVGNRPPQPGDVWMVKAYVAIAVDIAVNAGLGISRKRASRELAREYQFLATSLAPKTRNFAGAIESWHRQFEAGTIRDEDAQIAFNNRASLASCFKGKGKVSSAANETTKAFADLCEALDEVLLVATYLAARTASPETVEAYRKTLRTKPRS